MWAIMAFFLAPLPVHIPEHASWGKVFQLPSAKANEEMVCSLIHVSKPGRCYSETSGTLPKLFIIDLQREQQEDGFCMHNTENYTKSEYSAGSKTAMSVQEQHAAQVSLIS